MKVLFLTHNFPRYDGDLAGNFLLRFASALGKNGVDVRVVAPAEPGLDENARFNGTGVARFHYAPKKYETLAYGGNMAEQVRDSWSARFTLLGFLGAEFRAAVRERREFHPDVIHAHWWFPSGLVGTWLARLSNTPLVTTMHGSDVRIARSISMSRPAFRHVLQNSRATTAVSKWLAHEAQALVSTPAAVVAPMPVATELFTPGGSRDPNTLLFVGRLTVQKGVDVLLQALAKLPPQLRLTLDVVGDGPERQRLETLARELGIADRVRWHGAQTQKALVEFYRRATALVVPSADEGLGLVAVEAMLCETPVIAFASGGLPDVVQHDRTGFLVNERSPDSLRDAIEQLLAMPDAGRALGAAGRMHALSTFAPESVARRYIDIYQRAIENAPA
ncbi:MAG TPA: glycosyltransferase [Gemmatimonadaceae bacterium]|nr:glycosyltransferase [Gemmatimonadaceae bacterium]